MNDLINKIGTDKLLHFFVGAYITFALSNVIILQDALTGFRAVLPVIGGTLMAMLLELFKELSIDDRPDPRDILATLLGCASVALVNAAGALLHTLSH